MKRASLISYLDAYLQINTVQDYGPQGLQVETAGDEINLVAFSTDSALPCIESAAAANAQLLIVHHGLFWGNEQRLAGAFGLRVRRLFESNLSLYAAHLALDAHPEVGNNAELARLLNLRVVDWWGNAKGTKIGVVCDVSGDLAIDTFIKNIETALGVQVRAQLHGPQKIRRVGIISGSGTSFVAEAKSLGIDTFLTGETAHIAYYAAQEENLNLIYAGHYATETVGLKALARHLEEKFDLKTVWLEHPTGL